MTIMEETLDLLKTFYKKNGLDSAQLFRIGLRSGWTAILGTGKLCGTAFRFSGPHNVYQTTEPDIEVIDKLAGRDLMDIAGKYLNSDIMQMRSIAVAAISALSQPFLTVESLAERRFQVEDDRDYLYGILKPDDVVTLIGYGGMTQNILGRCKELHIADMRPVHSLPAMLMREDVKDNHEPVFIHGPDEDEALLNKSDVVVMTASSLVNGTFDDLICYAATARVKCLYGASASIIPDVLIKHGVSFIMSHHVRDPDKFIESMDSDTNMEQSIRNYQPYQVISAAKGDPK
ncbi:MAG: DUF364 domain-containing protein [Proteobacteria bacterium]|nr:DUF364 domain-containing protein [Pseudomonadota bacterium]